MVGEGVIVIGVGVGCCVSVGMDVCVGEGALVDVTVQVAGRMKTTSVGVSVGNCASDGIVGGGKGLRAEFGLTKITSDTPPTQKTHTKVRMVRIPHINPVRL